MMIRAGASNREMAAALGVNIPLLYRLVFACGVALAAFAGDDRGAGLVGRTRAWASRC